MISITIPTYNEADNLEKLLPQLFLVLKDKGIRAEVIVVDDNSADGTAAIARDLGKKYPIRVLQRPAKLGLSSAVLDGFKWSRGSILGVMDADLSHPPEKIHLPYHSIQADVGSSVLAADGV